MKTHRGDTWLDPEEYAYPAGSLRQSRRYCAARCPDGKIRRVKVGAPDTFFVGVPDTFFFFSIPATARVSGRTVAGFVSVSDSTGDFTFTPYTYRKNAGAFARKEAP